MNIQLLLLEIHIVQRGDSPFAAGGGPFAREQRDEDVGSGHRVLAATTLLAQASEAALGHRHRLSPIQSQQIAQADPAKLGDGQTTHSLGYMHQGVAGMGRVVTKVGGIGSHTGPAAVKDK